MAAGLVLFAHGARDPRWADPLKQVRERLAQRAPEVVVELAFLDIMTPDLPAAVSMLVARGCRPIVVVPVFLGQGGHVRRDLAALMQRLHAEHPHADLRSAPAVGEDEGILDALASYGLRMLEEPARSAGEADG